MTRQAADSGFEPLVSVIIPVYNRASLIGRAISSVLAQTYGNIEIIVVDDASSDALDAALSEFAGAKLRCIAHSANRGAAAARNTGVAAAQGEFVAFLDSDDLWSSEKLDRQVNALEANPDFSVVYCACCIQQVDAERRVTSEYVVRRPPPQHPSLYEDLLYNCVIVGGASSVLIRAGCIPEVGVFDETLPGSDWDLWRRLALSHQFLYLDEPLVQVRRHTTNMSKSFELLFCHQHMYLKKMRSDVPLKFRFHLLTVEALYYARGCRVYLVHKRSLLIFKFIRRLLLFSVLHPVPTARAVHALFKGYQCRRARNDLRVRGTLGRQ